MTTKFISGVSGVQSPLIKRTSVFGSKVDSNTHDIRPGAGSRGGGGMPTPGEGPLIMRVQTTAPSEQFVLSAGNVGVYNAVVDWGDGNQDTITAWNQAELTHTYAVANTYTITIDGVFPQIRMNASASAPKIQTIVQWGNIGWAAMDSSFRGCSNMSSIATDYPDTSAVGSLSYSFFGCSSLSGDIGFPLWDVGNVVVFQNAFRGSIFNRDISGWNTGSGTIFDSMFRDNSSFNQTLGAWNMTSATNLIHMLSNSGLSVSNYDATLIGWESQAVPNGLSLGATGLQYCAGEAARGRLISEHTWTITGDSKSAGCPTVQDIADYLVSEGWNATEDAGQLHVIYNSTEYWRSLEWLFGCDFSNVMQPLADDIRDAMNSYGYCT